MSFGVSARAARVVLLLACVAACKSQHERQREEHEQRPTSGAAKVRVGVVTLDPAAQTRAGITVAPLAAVTHRAEARAYGTVLDPQDFVDLRQAHAAAKADADKTQASLDASRKEYERLKALHGHDRNVSDKALQAAEATWRGDQASMQAARERLRAVDSTARQRWGDVLAPSAIEGSPPLDRMLARRDVLLQITLPAGVSAVSLPETATVQDVDGGLGSATLIAPAPRTDLRIQGVSFFYVASTDATGLRPGMNVLALVPMGAERSGVIVPASSVVSWQGKTWIYAQTDAEHFGRREVPTEVPVKDGWFVAEGVAAGEHVVVTGAQLLLSEELRQDTRGEVEGEGGEAGE